MKWIDTVRIIPVNNYIQIDAKKRIALLISTLLALSINACDTKDPNLLSDAALLPVEDFLYANISKELIGNEKDFIASHYRQTNNITELFDSLQQENQINRTSVLYTFNSLVMHVPEGIERIHAELVPIRGKEDGQAKENMRFGFGTDFWSLSLHTVRDNQPSYFREGLNKKFDELRASILKMFSGLGLSPEKSQDTLSAVEKSLSKLSDRDLAYLFANPGINDWSAMVKIQDYEGLGLRAFCAVMARQELRLTPPFKEVKNKDGYSVVFYNRQNRLPTSPSFFVEIYDSNGMCRYRGLLSFSKETENTDQEINIKLLVVPA